MTEVIWSVLSVTGLTALAAAALTSVGYWALRSLSEAPAAPWLREPARGDRGGRAGGDGPALLRRAGARPVFVPATTAPRRPRVPASL